jgi:hypothetical protein
LLGSVCQRHGRPSRDNEPIEGRRLSLSTDPLFGFNGKQLHIEKGLTAGLPSICIGRADVAARCLFSYGPNLPDTWHQAGVCVARILKG